jgi:hypothetical protein
VASKASKNKGRLLMEGENITLVSAVEKCQSYQTTQPQVKIFEEPNHVEQEIDTIEKYKKAPLSDYEYAEALHTHKNHVNINNFKALVTNCHN